MSVRRKQRTRALRAWLDAPSSPCSRLTNLDVIACKQQVAEMLRRGDIGGLFDVYAALATQGRSTP